MGDLGEYTLCHRHWKDNFRGSCFPGIRHSAEILLRRGAITNSHSIARSLSNISAKNYQNRLNLMCIEVIVCNTSVAFRHHVHLVCGVIWQHNWNSAYYDSTFSNINLLTGVSKFYMKPISSPFNIENKNSYENNWKQCLGRITATTCCGLLLQTRCILEAGGERSSIDILWLLHSYDFEVHVSRVVQSYYLGEVQ